MTKKVTRQDEIAAVLVTGHSKDDETLTQQDANDTRGLKRLERLDDIAAAVGRIWLQVGLALDARTKQIGTAG